MALVSGGGCDISGGIPALSPLQLWRFISALEKLQFLLLLLLLLIK